MEYTESILVTEDLAKKIISGKMGIDIPKIQLNGGAMVNIKRPNDVIVHPGYHLYVVATYFNNRTFVACINSPLAWEDFSNKYFNRKKIATHRFKLLSNDEHNLVMFGPRIKRVPIQSEWPAVQIIKRQFVRKHK